METIFLIFRAVAGCGFRPDVHETNLPCSMVITFQRSATTRRTSDCAHIHEIGVFRVNRNMPTLARSGNIAVLPCDCSVWTLTGYTDATIVLLRAINAIRELVICG